MNINYTNYSMEKYELSKIYIYIYISMFDFMVLKFELYSSGLILSKNIYLHLF